MTTITLIVVIKALVKLIAQGFTQDTVVVLCIASKWFAALLGTFHIYPHYLLLYLYTIHIHNEGP